jgi:hypothetical protein
MEQVEVSTPTDRQEWARIIGSWSPEERAAKEKKFLKKIDTHLLPILVSIEASLIMSVC